ncbi:hypothetical protein [Kingella kingae]|uniref:hypothetical protein n=1 Tax=Kingella kingae TaxID=504 RepID=UPI001E42976A|nr:hypothetical protein [Kingella kingae]
MYTICNFVTTIAGVNPRQKSRTIAVFLGQHHDEYNHSPRFRVSGLAANIRAEHAAADLSALWQSWQQSSLQSNIHAFSRTIYCVYHQYQAMATNKRCWVI